MRDLPLAELDDRFGEDIEALLHHQPAEEDDCDIVIRQTMRAAPLVVALRRMENRPIDPAGPDRDIVMHPLRTQFFDLALRGGNQRIAPLVEPPEDRLDRGFEETESVISGVGLEPRMDRCKDGNIALARPFQRGMRDRIGRRQVDEIRLERVQIGADAIVDPQWEAVFAPALHRHADVGHVDQIAGRREIGFGDHGRVDTQPRTALEQVACQAVEGLVRAVAGVIVIPAKQSDAKIGHIHLGAL